MLPQTPIANGAHDSPARLLFVERALECQRARAVPHGGVHGLGPTELGKIAGQAVINVGISLKCENISLRSNAMCGKYSVKTNVRAHVEIDIAGLEQHVEALAHVRFIHSGPHLPLDAVVQIRFKSHTWPGSRNAAPSADPPGQFSDGIREAA